ncbi:glycoside hydrolase superfamily [Halteromyces radiatus]|uniref:glycoside hydrolase superfamily n=1 Tax=Halteromyces radiatus TaxID=101107 RepID=UPI00221E4EAC|nr:glycoside hydrolase superfamily [Halteromyces radiatus]KAI8083176.1 glycoside hydrolase superfamily [Halteromyces radiatus]
MEKEIQTCQKKGKKVLLSLGGASGSYGLNSGKDGKMWADQLWNTFGNGQVGNKRPFGKAVVDGFDLDIEAGSVEGYSTFVKTMRQHYLKDKSKTYYISGAPQCPYPDAWLGDALNQEWFDFVWIQFYNNYCSVKGGQFNYDTWENWAKKKSKNKNVQLFLGIPASASAAGSGYVPLSDLVKTISKLKSSPHFGGVMMWDVSQAYAQKVNFAKAVAKLVHKIKNNGGDDQDDKPITTETAAINIPTSSLARINSPTGTLTTKSKPSNKNSNNRNHHQHRTSTLLSAPSNTPESR